MSTITADRSLEKLAGLLALAENTDNEAEREAFMDKAQQLSTLYSIDLAVARAHAENKNASAKPTNKRIQIGDHGKRGLANFVNLMIAIAEANNLKITIAHNSTYVYLWGFEEDIELTERLYASLLAQMVTASEAWLDTGEYKTLTMGRQVTRRDAFGTYKNWRYDAPVPKTTARANFQKAFANRIGQRLRDAQQKATEEAVAEDAMRSEPLPTKDNTPGTALVLAMKARTVDEYFKKNNNARGTWRGGRRSSGRVDSARNAGRSAANSARLSSPTSIGGARGELR